MIDDEMILDIHKWCMANGVTFQAKGEVGFGRPCVGILDGQSYVEWDYDLNIWSPEDAYHKHDCLAVLVHGDDYDRALEQLHTWVVWLTDQKITISRSPRETYNKDGFGRDLELMMGGLSQTKLRRTG